MSAFVVSVDEIDLLVTAGHAVTAGKFSAADLAAIADKAGAMLLTANVESVNFRYSESEPVPAYAWTPVLEMMDPAPLHWVQVWKSASCFDYQACESPDYKDSTAARYVEALQAHALATLRAAGWPVTYRAAYKEELPAGDDVAEWSWSREDGFSKLEERAAQLAKLRK
jgi:hypothetical protein